MSAVYLGLGSNLGDRQQNLQTAVDELGKIIKLTAASAVYETPPWGVTDQPAFLNACVRGETELEAEALLDEIKQIEQTVGRTKTYRWGPREIDIDILFYGDEIISSQRLTIPHPRLHERDFVLVPLNDIAPGIIHPKLGQTLTQMLNQFDQTGIKATPQKLAV